MEWLGFLIWLVVAVISFYGMTVLHGALWAAHRADQAAEQAELDRLLDESEKQQ